MDFQQSQMSTYMGLSGHVLTMEERTAMQGSLTILKHEAKFDSVTYWGKILGIKNDYHIAQGYMSNLFAPKTSFYRYATNLFG